MKMTYKRFHNNVKFMSYLKNRTQYVEYKGNKSDNFNVQIQHYIIRSSQCFLFKSYNNLIDSSDILDEPNLLVPAANTRRQIDFISQMPLQIYLIRIIYFTPVSGITISIILPKLTAP